MSLIQIFVFKVVLHKVVELVLEELSLIWDGLLGLFASWSWVWFRLFRLSWAFRSRYSWLSWVGLQRVPRPISCNFSMASSVWVDRRRCRFSADRSRLDILIWISLLLQIKIRSLELLWNLILILRLVFVREQVLKFAQNVLWLILSIVAVFQVLRGWSV